MLAADSNEASRPLVPISRGKTDRRELGRGAKPSSSCKRLQTRKRIDWTKVSAILKCRSNWCSIDAKSCVHLYELGEYAFPKVTFERGSSRLGIARTVRLHSAVGRDLRTDSSSATADTCFA